MLILLEAEDEFRCQNVFFESGFPCFYKDFQRYDYHKIITQT